MPCVFTTTVPVPWNCMVNRAPPGMPWPSIRRTSCCRRLVEGEDVLGGDADAVALELDGVQHGAPFSARKTWPWPVQRISCISWPVALPTIRPAKPAPL